MLGCPFFLQDFEYIWVCHSTIKSLFTSYKLNLFGSNLKIRYRMLKQHDSLPRINIISELCISLFYYEFQYGVIEKVKELDIVIYCSFFSLQFLNPLLSHSHYCVIIPQIQQFIAFSLLYLYFFYSFLWSLFCLYVSLTASTALQNRSKII